MHHSPSCLLSNGSRDFHPTRLSQRRHILTRWRLPKAHFIACHNNYLITTVSRTNTSTDYGPVVFPPNPSPHASSQPPTQTTMPKRKERSEQFINDDGVIVNKPKSESTKKQKTTTTNPRSGAAPGGGETDKDGGVFWEVSPWASSTDSPYEEVRRNWTDSTPTAVEQATIAGVDVSGKGDGEYTGVLREGWADVTGEEGASLPTFLSQTSSGFDEAAVCMVLTRAIRVSL